MFSKCCNVTLVKKQMVGIVPLSETLSRTAERQKYRLKQTDVMTDM